MLPYAALTDVGLDNLSAAFLQNHFKLRYGLQLEPSKLVQNRLSILQLAHGIASALEKSQGISQQMGRTAVLDPHEIEAKLLNILEGGLLPHN